MKSQKSGKSRIVYGLVTKHDAANDNINDCVTLRDADVNDNINDCVALHDAYTTVARIVSFSLAQCHITRTAAQDV